jgi:hypothetical protein
MTTPDDRPPEGDEDLHAAFVGRNWERHYRASFRAAAERGYYAFNWAAALAPMWLAYRGFLALQLVACVLSFVVAVIISNWWRSAGLVLTFVAPYVVIGAIEGAAADWLVHHRSVHAIAQVRKKAPASDAAPLAVRRKGGVSKLGVVVVTAVALLVLAYSVYTTACACGPTKERAYVAMMKSDLRNLVTAEQSYFQDNATYTASVGNLGYSESAGNTVTVSSASRTGWAATATNRSTMLTCGIYVGRATAPVTGQIEGEPKCL